MLGWVCVHSLWPLMTVEATWSRGSGSGHFMLANFPLGYDRGAQDHIGSHQSGAASGGDGRRARLD